MKEWAQHITINPDVRFGKPCLRGTRVTVEDVLNWLAAGKTHQEIFDDFPYVTEDHIRATLMWAAQREKMIDLVVA